MKKRIQLGVKILVSAALLVYLFSQIDFRVFWDQLQRANIGLVILAALLFYVGVYVSVLRWSRFLLFYEIRLTRRALFDLYLIGAFLNNFLPSSIGGDGYKVYRLARQFPERKKEALSSIVYERGSGFLLLMIVNLATFLMFYKLIAAKNILIFLIEFGLLAGVAVFFIFRKTIVALLERLNVGSKFINKLINFLKVLFAFNDKRVFLEALLISLLFLLNAAFGAWLLFMALGASVNIFYILFASTFSQIVAILPISINALGVLEGASVFLYSMVGVPAEISLAMSLIARVSMMLTSSIGGLRLLKTGDHISDVNATTVKAIE